MVMFVEVSLDPIYAQYPQKYVYYEEKDENLFLAETLKMLSDWSVSKNLKKCNRVNNPSGPRIIPNNRWELNPTDNNLPEWFLLSFVEYNTISYQKILSFAKTFNIPCKQFYEKITNIKRIAVVFGNCQTEDIMRVLNTCPDFVNKYVLVKTPFVHEFTKYYLEFETCFLKTIDLFIFHHVSADNAYSVKLSTDYLKSLLSPSCNILCIPNCYFTGYFPGLIPSPRKALNGSRYHYNGGVIPTTCSYLQNLFKEGYTDEEIYYIIMHDNFIPSNIIQDNLVSTISELERREVFCDIIISDYIRDNYSHNLLFHTENHPTLILIAELVKRILNKIGYSNISIDITKLPERNGYQLPIYPCVKFVLNLTFKLPTSYSICEPLNEKPLDMLSYIKFERYFNNPDNRNKTFEWIKKPVNHTLDISSEIWMDTNVIVPRGHVVFTINGGNVHLALYLNVLKKQETIIRIPKEYAPYLSFITPAFCKIQISVDVLNTGNIILRLNQSCGEIFIVDTFWNIG